MHYAARARARPATAADGRPSVFGIVAHWPSGPAVNRTGVGSNPTDPSTGPAGRHFTVDVVQRQVRSSFKRATRVRLPSSTPRVHSKKPYTQGLWFDSRRVRSMDPTPMAGTLLLREHSRGFSTRARDLAVGAGAWSRLISADRMVRFHRLRPTSVSYSGKYVRLSNGRRGFESRHRPRAQPLGEALHATLIRDQRLVASPLGCATVSSRCLG